MNSQPWHWRFYYRWIGWRLTRRRTQREQDQSIARGGMPAVARKPCVHDSTRADGTLDRNCLLCGADGYWHDGHRHDRGHPSGKVLFVVDCEAAS